MKPAARVNSDEYTLVDFLESPNGDLFEKAEMFYAFLDDWKGRGTYSYHRELRSSCTTRTTIRDSITGEDREFIVLASNNYLGLNTRPEVIEAGRRALAEYGSGMCGSRFLSGTYDLV